MRSEAARLNWVGNRVRRAVLLLGVGACLLPVASGQTPVNACDLNKDGVVNDADVTIAMQMVLGQSACSSTIAGPNVCNIVMVQRVINARNGGVCIDAASHSVTLNWVASTSSTVVGYHVMRSTTSGSGYVQITTTPIAGVTYTDNAVTAGASYYYVVVAVDSAGNKSANSNEAPAVIPTP